MRRQLPFRMRLLTAAPLLALALTACGGSGSGGDGIASAQKDAPNSAGSTSAKAGADSSVQAELAKYLADQRAYVRCLRSNGVNVGDPDAKGVVDFTKAGDVKQDPVKRKALEKCSPGRQSLELTKYLNPKYSAKEIATFKAYAKCMQENGAPDFPDYDDDGYPPLDSAWNQDTPTARHAYTFCIKKVYNETFDPNNPNAKG